jgi:hypothetical protein
LIVPHPDRLWRTQEFENLTDSMFAQSCLPDLPDIIVA